MPSIFNLTFFIILGIMLLVVALLVVYFENKMREQNHKIASMLSLVSSLAEEVNGVKFGINHLVMRGGVTEPVSKNENMTLTPTNHLITVSDGEDDSEEEEDNSEYEDEDISEEDEESSEDELEIDADSISESNNNDIKILKLNINNTERTNSYDDNDLELEQADELDEFDDLEELEDFKSESSKTPELSNNFTDDALELHEINEMSKHDFDNDTVLDNFDISSANLKTINIHLEEHVENVDYKKMTLAKLRTTVTEKGLTNDASKLKKNELLKLLGVE